MKFRFHPTPRFAYRLVLLAGALSLTTASTAASPCKGKQADACAAAEQCVWVDSYERRDGRSVASHCKTRRGMKRPAQADLDSLKLSRNR